MNEEIIQAAPLVGHFTVLLSATRRGARLARLLTERQLADWGLPSEAAEHVVAELAANAVVHGRVPGRDFRLALRLDAHGTLRIEVTDARGDRVPHVPNSASAYADRWGVDEALAPCRTVWAELVPGQVDP
ncbi:ATP-binding protein [Streptomyces sp. NPDC050548]|uniref:ATP-binding protein n=1 Tax=Streptomyces sp. NPDC050548 TaxID=3365629 RepID=UPI0037A11F1E